ncbi:MAG: helicase-associated domain-containing protein [Candidatus Poribacteria bacterium]|nr:helicase-associated domain-containing protein [Candidatus Poribacteria bacterium]MDE0503877.1 helicase-associated domain-containing protein [Candidatus Poribacteria bacterium]
MSGQLSVQSLRKKIPERVLNIAWLKATITRLNPHERSLLTTLTFLSGSHGVTVDLFNRKLKQLCRGWSRAPEQVRQSLHESGLIFLVSTGHFQHIYMIPEDLQSLLLKVFSDEINAGLISPGAAPKSIRSDRFALLQDTFTFLSTAERDGIRLTQRLTVHKHAQKRLLNAFEVTEDTTKIYDRINPPDGTTDRLHFIHNFCQHHQLVHLDNSNNLHCSELGHEWIQKSNAEKLSTIFQYWLKHDVYPSRQLTMAHSLLRILSENRWVKLSSILGQVQRLSVEETWEQTLYSHLERRFTNYLTYMGCVNFNATAEDSVIQLTEIGMRLIAGQSIADIERESTFVLQPNYEILASSNLAPGIRWKLNLIAEIHQASQVITYKLTPQSIYNSLRAGMSVNEILAFLEAYSKTGIPQNVKLSIHEWGTRYGQVYFMDVMLLRCKNERLAQELKSNKQIAKHILGEVSPSDLVISRERFEELKRLLEKNNIMPLAEVVTLEN